MIVIFCVCNGTNDEHTPIQPSFHVAALHIPTSNIHFDINCDTDLIIYSIYFAKHQLFEGNTFSILRCECGLFHTYCVVAVVTLLPIRYLVLLNTKLY